MYAYYKRLVQNKRDSNLVAEVLSSLILAVVDPSRTSFLQCLADHDHSTYVTGHRDDPTAFTLTRTKLSLLQIAALMGNLLAGAFLVPF
jgi:hypothetical protein